jgi:flagellar protein FliT
MSASDETPDGTTSHLTNPAKDAGYQVITNYESLSAITSQMRDAAVHGEWDQLIGLEQQCSQHVATMKPVDATAMLDEPARQRKIQLIKKILADDAEIRNRTETWMGQLQRIIQSNRQEQRLHQAYGV